MIDLYGTSTQHEFGNLVGISQPAVSGLVARGVLKAGDAVGVWLLAYCSHMREIAKARNIAASVTLADIEIDGAEIAATSLEATDQARPE